MSDPLPPPVVPNWEPLSADERRVLGVLIEKQKTSKSADAYPMTLNSIVTGCNQKSNRDPVTEYDEDEVEETLTALQGKGLVMKVVSSRADRWRHLLYEFWKATKIEMAILAELLLRGPQTEGDLRGRASRMEEIADLDELRGHLKNLVDRKQVVYLSEPGRRGTMVTHGFHPAEDYDRLRKTAAAGASALADAVSTRSSGPSTSAMETRLDEAFAEIARLRDQVVRLEQAVTALTTKPTPGEG